MADFIVLFHHVAPGDFKQCSVPKLLQATTLILKSESDTAVTDQSIRHEI